MSTSRKAPSWGSVIGFAIGVGLSFVATLGVWLEYSTPSLNALSGGAISLAAGLVVGAVWALLRREA